MPKEETKTVGGLVGRLSSIAESAAKITVYMLLFLIPLLVLPFTSDPFEFNKQAVLAVLVFVGLASWMVKAIAEGSFQLRKSHINTAVLVFTAACLLSTLFSAMRYGSFWGYPISSAASFLSVACFVLLFFLISNLFAEREILDSFVVLGAGAFIAQVYGVLQMAGLHIIPFGMGQNPSFNTIGSVGSLGIFAAVLLPAFIILSITSRGWRRVLFLANIAAGLCVFLTINYPVVWWAAFAGAFFAIVFWVSRRHIFDGRWLFLPMFFLVVSLLFAIFRFYLPWGPVSVEVSLSQKANIQMVQKAISQAPVLGTGPGTFAYNFAKHKDPSISQTQLWNVSFPSGASYVLTLAVELGVVGFLALLGLLAMPLWYGVRYLLKNPDDDGKKTRLVALCLPSLTAGIVAYFLYPSNITLNFIWFMMLAMFAAAIFTRKSEYELKGSSLATMSFIFAFSFVFIFGAGIMLMGSQRYVAEVYYNRALSAQNTDSAITLVKKAANYNPNMDIYFSRLSILSLLKLQELDGAQEQVQGLVNDAINAANIAVNINPNNPNNWSTKAYVCQSLIGVSDDAVSCAHDAYEKSVQLDPSNPYLFLQMGNVYLSQSQLEGVSTEDKNKLIGRALESYQKAVELKKDYIDVYFQMAAAYDAKGDSSQWKAMLDSAERESRGDPAALLSVGVAYFQKKDWSAAQNRFQRALQTSPLYANALYYAGLTYDNQGQKYKAIEMFSKILENNADNETIKKIVENLKAGRGALAGLSQDPQPPTPEVEAASSEKKE